MANLTANITQFPYPTNLTSPINDLFAYTFTITNDFAAFGILLVTWVIFYLTFRDFPNSDRMIVANFVTLIVTIAMGLVDSHLSYLIGLVALALVVSVILKTQE